MRNQWQAIIHANGLGMSFHQWIATRGFPYFPDDFWDREWISKAYEAVLQEANLLSRSSWSAKQSKLKDRLQKSFSDSGGRCAFQRIKTETLPEVTMLFQKIHLDLEQQRWEAEGNDVIFVRNAHCFNPDEVFHCKSGCKQIVAVLRNRLVFDSKLSVDEARKLQKLVPLPNPQDIANNFFQGWNAFWCRDVPDEPPPAEFQNWFDTLPDWEPMAFDPISFEEWQAFLRKAKTKSMRGADGFSVKELRLLPEGIFHLLNLIFTHAENHKVWPSILTKTWVILLPKVEGALTWQQVRPISISSMIYRAYARIRTSQILSRLPPLHLPFVSLGIPTSVHWATLLDRIQFARDSDGILAGIVCDLLKAFNCLNRQVVLRLASKGGVPLNIIDAWSGALLGLKRQILLDGLLFGEEYCLIHADLEFWVYNSESLPVCRVSGICR